MNNTYKFQSIKHDDTFNLINGLTNVSNCGSILINDVPCGHFITQSDALIILKWLNSLDYTQYEQDYDLKYKRK